MIKIPRCTRTVWWGFKRLGGHLEEEISDTTLISIRKRYGSVPVRDEQQVSPLPPPPPAAAAEPPSPGVTDTTRPVQFGRPARSRGRVSTERDAVQSRLMVKRMDMRVSSRELTTTRSSQNGNTTEFDPNQTQHNSPSRKVRVASPRLVSRRRNFQNATHLWPIFFLRRTRTLRQLVRASG
ncbi:hypothetical protein F2P81_013730 [Scophthalmus maximus]|uniref:Uncharacterized protein n=1 Tax=Scophthalmus maximus TaxID=52904 RepID=A0A6A4SRK4_SCOMX|nr:hypothetical protein F2P81_013730 [Scophthalmus maximus]